MVSISISGSMDAILDEAGRRLAHATKAGVAAATEGLKLELRQHIAAVLGPRAGNMIGARVYPERGGSPTAAGQIYPRSGNAEQILRAFTEGVTITRRDGIGYLALPTDKVPPLGEGVRATPKAVETYFGRPLRFVPPHVFNNRFGLYVLDNVVRAKNGRGVRNATRGRRRQGRQAESVVMFILVPRVQMPKKLSPEPIGETWASRVPDLIERAMPRAR